MAQRRKRSGQPESARGIDGFEALEWSSGLNGTPDAATLLCMKPRFRVLAALLALFAFSASFAEGLWASTCAPMDSMASMDGSRASTGHMESEASDAHGQFLEPGSSQRESPDSAPSCPLTPIIGGCVAVFPPAPDAALAFVATIHTDPMVVLELAPDLLLVSSLLRPPRA